MKTKMLALVMIAILPLFSVPTEAAVRSYSKGQILKEIAAWQEDIKDFEDLEDKGTKIRRDWLFRLQFLIERRYDGSENSLQRILKFMVELDKKGEQHEKSDDLLLNQRLLEAIEKVREKHEPLWMFVQSYVEDVDPTNPPTIDEFSKSRDYINNFQGVSAKRISSDELEALLESLDQPFNEKVEYNFK